MSKNPSAVTLAFEQAEWDIHLGIIPEEITKGSNLVLYRDGEYLLRENAIGVFFRKISDGLYRGLPMGPESFFKFSLPKIPKEILSKQVSFYRATMKRCNQAEAYSIVMYDKEKQEYFLVIPKQKVSKGSVQYSQKDLREKYPSNRYIEVISAHSHNTMGAYFSGIDDRDEQGDMVYMVMGKLDQPSPSFSIRANLYGKQCCFVSLEDIFDITLDEWNDLSPSWNDLHDINWMEQLNVEADYRSAHFEGSFTSERSRQRIPRQWPTSNRGKVTVYGAHGEQQSFDFEAYAGFDEYHGSIAHIFTEAASILRYSQKDPTQVLVDVINTMVDFGHAQKLNVAIAFSNLDTPYEFEVDSEDLVDPITLMPDSFFDQESD